MTAVNPRIRTPRLEVRERILAAATSEFARKGFAGTTIDAIADTAGFTKGAVYSNFGSKDDLFFALLDEQIAHRLEVVAALAGDTVARTSMREAGNLLMQEVLANRDWQLLFTEYWLRAMRDSQVREKFVEHRRAVRALIERTVDQLDLHPGLDSEAAAVLVLALNNGLAIEEFTDPGTVPHDLFGTVLQALAAPDSQV